MNKKSLFLVLSLLGIAILFISAGIYAGTTAPDVIKMENKIYDKHTKGIVEFSHKKHVVDYKGTCGECHHDATGKPLDLKEGDAVQSCAECHSKAGLAPKGKDAPKLTPKEKLSIMPKQFIRIASIVIRHRIRRPEPKMRRHPVQSAILKRSNPSMES